MDTRHHPTAMASLFSLRARPRCLSALQLPLLGLLLAAGPLAAQPAQEVQAASPEHAAEIARIKAAMADPDPRPLTVVAPADPALYRAMGGTAGLQTLVDEMLRRALVDPRLKPFFGGADMTRLSPMLTAQFCQLSGGPCRYEGVNMRKAHAGMDLTKADFNALVETLQDCMDQQHIPFSVQNRFLAQLAPMHRDVVNTR